MKVQKIKITDIMVPETRVTAVYPEEIRELLHSTIEALGVLQPIVVVKTEDHYELVDGLHRLEELQRSQALTCDAVVYEGKTEDTLLMNLVLNRVRGKVKASEMVTVIKVLWQEYGFDSDKIRERTGLTRNYIEKLQRISTAAPSLQDALDQELIGVGHAYEISRLPTHLQQDEVIAKMQIWHFSVQEVKEFIDKTLEAMKTVPVEGVPAVALLPREYRCEGCHEVVEPRYLRPVVVCPDCFGQLWRLGKAAKEAEAKTEATSEDEG